MLMPFKLSPMLIFALLSLGGIAHAEVRISSVVTGFSKGAIEATVVNGGSWWQSRQLVHQAIIIEHPKGRLLFDSGIAPRTEKALENAGWLDRQLFAVTGVNSLISQLQQQGMAVEDFTAIIPSHLHWDHTGGLADFNQVPVWVSKQGLTEAMASKTTLPFMPTHINGDINWQFYTLNDKSYRGFDRSSDIFADGSVVLVNLSGHSEGHWGLFVRTTKAQYFFIGDSTWLLEGISNNQPRPKLTQWMSSVDSDYQRNSVVIERIHSLQQQDPDLMIVPAHDERVAAGLPRFPLFGG